MNKNFNIWRQEESYKQIHWIAALTATIYIFMSFANYHVAPESIRPSIIIHQLFIISSVLFFIAYLAYKRKNFFIVEGLLFLSPLFAAAVHTIILSEMEVYSSYQTELYLMIFWIYTISGLRLTHAIISSIIIFIMGIVGPYYSYQSQNAAFILHVTWMSISITFGIVSGYLMQESKKSTFLKEQQLNELASKDKLTGVYNRVRFDEILNSELSRAKRYNSSLGLMLLDIDFFKTINDTYGHITGDKVLIQLADIIQRKTRTTDIIFRWGGEEFVILCLEVDKQKLLTLAEHIRKSIEEVQHESIISLTLSVGTTVSLPEDTNISILKRADEALYLAKENGRNRIEFS